MFLLKSINVHPDADYPHPESIYAKKCQDPEILLH